MNVREELSKIESKRKNTFSHGQSFEKKNKRHLSRSVQHDSLIFVHFLQFPVFLQNVRNFLFLYDWIEHRLLYRTI